VSEHEVVGRDVPVHDALAVQISQREECLMRDLQREREVRRMSRDHQVGEVDSLDELHDEIGRAVVVQREVMDRADMRVLQPGRRLGLLDEPALELFVADHLRTHDFDDANLVQQLVANLVDGAHAAFPDLSEDLVFSLDESARLGQCTSSGRRASGF
jgi:hypothetical protein